MFHVVLIQLFFDLFLVHFSHEDEIFLRQKLGRFFYPYLIFYILFLFVFRSDSKIKREYNRRVQIFLKQSSEVGLRYKKKSKRWLKDGSVVNTSDFSVAFNGFDGRIHVNTGVNHDKNQIRNNKKNKKNNKKEKLHFERKDKLLSVQIDDKKKC